MKPCVWCRRHHGATARPRAHHKPVTHCAVTVCTTASGRAAALWPCPCRRPFANKARVFWQELVRWRGVVLKHGAGVPLGERQGGCPPGCPPCAGGVRPQWGVGRRQVCIFAIGSVAPTFPSISCQVLNLNQSSIGQMRCNRADVGSPDHFGCAIATWRLLIRVDA